jgi:hypothetical protein
MNYALDHSSECWTRLGIVRNHTYEAQPLNLFSFPLHGGLMQVVIDALLSQKILHTIHGRLEVVGETAHTCVPVRLGLSRGAWLFLIGSSICEGARAHRYQRHSNIAPRLL